MSNSSLHNYGAAELADALGEAKAALRGAKARVNALQNELTRRGWTRAVGHQYTVTRSRFERLEPDRDALKQALGERWSYFLMPVPVTRWNVSEIEHSGAARVSAAEPLEFFAAA